MAKNLPKLRQSCAGTGLRGAHCPRALLLLAAILLLQGPLLASKKVRQIVPGVLLITDIDRALPRTVYVVEIDLKRPYLILESVKGNDKLIGREKTSEMVARRSWQGHRVLAAINGDFFQRDGQPVNLQISEGEIVRGPGGRSAFAVSQDGQFDIALHNLRPGIVVRDTLRRAISAVNANRTEDALIFYNHFWGATTGTNIYGTEVRLRALRRFAVNTVMAMVVTERRSGGPPLALDKQSYILSAHGRSDAFVKANLAIGDTVLLNFDLSPGAAVLKEAIGGTPRLMKNGIIDISWRQERNPESFVFSRHPRTALGYDRTSEKLFFVVVDGRQENYSIGMTLHELADYMRRLGCSEALNLDGGGSTTMVVRGEVVNRPSDATGERPVANALLLVSTRVED